MSHEIRFRWFCACAIGATAWACTGEGPGRTTVRENATAGASSLDAPLAGSDAAGSAPPAGSFAPPATGGVSGGTPVVQAGTQAPPAGAGSVLPTGEVTYHAHIRPIIEARCLGCHVEGASGPFALDAFDKVAPVGAAVVNAVTTRRMPPWLADSTDCTKIRDDQRLTDEQLALFTQWQEAGFPPGNEADFLPLDEAPPPALGEPNLVIKPRDPHQLTAGREYYACEQVDTRITEDTWVIAMDMVPENPEYVHHAIVSVGNGTCSALGITAENVYSYRPGSRTLVFEEGDAMLIRAGQVIAIQFHYNTRFAPRGTALPTDSSAYRLWTLPSGVSPERAIVRMPHHDMLINIPVNAVNQKEGGTQSIGSEYTRAGSEIIGISPHMHYLGQQFHETLRKADGTEICLVDIPDWDQDWQLDYMFEPSAFIPVGRGDRVIQECVYSNRPQDQGTDPEGNLFTPQYTRFGEDTREEMCLGYIWFRYPL